MYQRNSCQKLTIMKYASESLAQKRLEAMDLKMDCTEAALGWEGRIQWSAAALSCCPLTQERL